MKKAYILLLGLICVICSAGLSVLGLKYLVWTDDVYGKHEVSAYILSDEDGIDIDLTNLSTTMLFSEIYNIVVNFEEYSGKYIKITGVFGEYKDLISQEYFPAIFISDATACCVQSFALEFLDYSEIENLQEDDKITIVGKIELAREVNGNPMYYKLTNAYLKNI